MLNGLSTIKINLFIFNIILIQINLEIKPCEDKMCLNGGKCKMFPSDEMDIGCDCPANFTGIYCENSNLNIFT